MTFGAGKHTASVPPANLPKHRKVHSSYTPGDLFYSKPFCFALDFQALLTLSVL